MSGDLLQTKLYVPGLRPFLVPRPHLIQKLNTGLTGKLTLISAPAGFGILNLLILRQMGIAHIMGILALSVTILAAVLLILTNVYLWPLLVIQDPPLLDLLKNGIRLGIVHPFWGLLVAGTAVIPLALSLVLPGFFLLTMPFAAAALIRLAHHPPLCE